MNTPTTNLQVKKGSLYIYDESNETTGTLEFILDYLEQLKAQVTTKCCSGHAMGPGFDVYTNEEAIIRINTEINAFQTGKHWSLK